MTAPQQPQQQLISSGGETPLRRFVCPRCGKTVDSLAIAVSHPCPVAGFRVALRRQRKPRVREEETP